MNLPDNIYNWIENFFRDHSRCTRFGDEVSKFRESSASIIQGSGLGPASYVVTASDLHPVTPGNSAVKFADDTYLVIPAANVQSCAAVIAQVENWAAENNLSLNRSKSVEIVFVSPWSKRAVIIPPPSAAVSHVDNLLESCAQTLFAMRTLRHQGLSTNAPQA